MVEKNSSHMKNFQAFKAYDIRGIYGVDVTDEMAYKVGLIYGSVTKSKKIAVGWDIRPSSSNLSNALLRGLVDGGTNVESIGTVTTDTLYFAVIHHCLDGGIMITASHNPAKFNGMKCVGKLALPLGLGSGLEKIRDRLKLGNLKKSHTPGIITIIDILPEYIHWLRNFTKPHLFPPMKIVIDCGNGAGGLLMSSIFEKTDVKVIPLFFEPDGDFPNHVPNPLIEENRKHLIQAVVDHQADFGVGLDGDADRAFFVDQDGKFCPGDFIIGLMSESILNRWPGCIIGFDIRCSRFVPNKIKSLGGKGELMPIGHARAKNWCRQKKAGMGAELAGHYYFRYPDDRFYAYFDSGALATLVLLQTLSSHNITLKEALKDTVNNHVSGEINIQVTENIDSILNKIERKYINCSGISINKFDGVTISTNNWWFNIRKSNTEPLVRLCVEGITKDILTKVTKEAVTLIIENSKNYKYVPVL